LYSECLAGAQIIFPKSGRGLGNMTLQFFAYDRSYLQNYFSFPIWYIGGFVLGMLSRRTNNFPESWRGLGHATPTIFGSTVGYPSDSLASCFYLVTFLFILFVRHSGILCSVDAPLGYCRLH